MHTKYQHGGDIYSNKVSIDYSANINPLGLPQGVKEELARCIEEPVCCVYPDSQCRDLVKALADYHKVTQDWILCGDGAADLIFGLAFALKPKKALLLAPSFLEYEQALKAVDCDIDLFYLKEEMAIVWMWRNCVKRWNGLMPLIILPQSVVLTNRNLHQKPTTATTFYFCATPTTQPALP